MTRPSVERDRSRQKFAAVAVALLVASVVAATCTGERPENDAQQPAPPPGAITRWKIVPRNVADPFIPADPFNVPAAGYRFVAVELTIENTSGNQLTVHPTEWIFAVTERGNRLPVATLAAQPGDISSGGPDLGKLDSGESLDGVIVFEVPVSDRLSSLYFRDDIDPPESGEIALASK